MVSKLSITIAREITILLLIRMNTLRPVRKCGPDSNLPQWSSFLSVETRQKAKCMAGAGKPDFQTRSDCEQGWRRCLAPWPDRNFAGPAPVRCPAPPPDSLRVKAKT